MTLERGQKVVALREMEGGSIVRGSLGVVRSVDPEGVYSLWFQYAKVRTRIPGVLLGEYVTPVRDSRNTSPKNPSWDRSTFEGTRDELGLYAVNIED